MDPNVVAHLDGDITQANLHPRTAAKYLKRYPVPAAQEAAS